MPLSVVGSIQEFDGILQVRVPRCQALADVGAEPAGRREQVRDP